MAKSSTDTKSETTESPASYSCGLIMPISSIDGCSAEHWAEVKVIIGEAVESIAESRYIVRLVSDADDIGVLQKRIVQNVYSSDIVVCDVSGKNPNVMFELGLRLAFDKPTIIVKDDKTDYSFDTGVIEHVGYPRDLRFSRIVEFKKILAAKVVSTHKAALADPDHSTFLKNFGKFKVASLTSTEVSAERVILDSLSEIQAELAILRRRSLEPPIRSGNRSAQKTEATEALLGAILKVAASESTPMTDELVMNIEFMRKVERELPASRYFGTQVEFETTCRALMRYLVATQSSKPAT
jgi:hypothetical protein